MGTPVLMPDVLCPNCVEQGYLEVYAWLVYPVLNCQLCQWFVFGRREGDDLVFPDPHVQPDR